MMEDNLPLRGNPRSPNLSEENKERCRGPRNDTDLQQLVDRLTPRVPIPLPSPTIPNHSLSQKRVNRRF